MTGGTPIGRRFTAIWLPGLAMQRWRRQTAEQGEASTAPLALIRDGPHGPVLHAVCPLAASAGLAAEMRLTDARALIPTLAILPADPPGDAHWLESIGLAAQRWSPWVALAPVPDPDDPLARTADATLLLDTRGVEHLFGGEQGLLADAAAALEAQGLEARLAIAPTIGAAWALAHHGAAAQTICSDDRLAAHLAPLPVEALRLDAACQLLLRWLGLKTIGDLAALPRDALMRRFRRPRGAWGNPLLRLDQALGRVPEQLAPLVPPARYRATRRVLEPIRHRPLLDPVIDDLALELGAALAEATRGARRIRFSAWRLDGHVVRIEAETAAASRDAAHLAWLLRPRLDGIDAGFGLDVFALEALRHEPLSARQRDLAGGEMEEGDRDTALARLVDRLAARLGSGAVRRPVLRASHLPERSVVWASALEPAPPGAPERLALHDRPLKLLTRPEPIAVVYATPEGLPRRFRWRQRTHDIKRVEGPERIAPEWWRERSTARLRDYYAIEDEAGERYWIYRLGLVDDGRGGPPDWYLHGLFG